jgi:hypothetical protein
MPGGNSDEMPFLDGVALVLQVGIHPFVSLPQHQTDVRARYVAVTVRETERPRASLRPRSCLLAGALRSTEGRTGSD